MVDPNPSTPGTPGLAAQAAVATSERLGFRAEAVASKPDEPFDLALIEADLDLVVLVVGTEPAGQVAAWSESTWCVPARLTAGFASLGIDVLTVSAGAGAAALIGCYEQGATILFDLDELPAELTVRRRHLGPHRSGGLDSNAGRLPHRIEGLLQLTASERRVLFYLTSGMSAQDIADIQVVSLTTVRSHIRSILRKLGVRSQLAAVVCANSRDLGRIQPIDRHRRTRTGARGGARPEKRRARGSSGRRETGESTFFQTPEQLVLGLEPQPELRLLSRR